MIIIDLLIYHSLFIHHSRIIDLQFHVHVIFIVHH